SVVVRKLDYVPLTAERSQLEPPVGAQQGIEATFVGRIGVEDPRVSWLALAHEHADARTVRPRPDVRRLALQGLLVLVVVLKRHLALVEADVEVEVEVTASRRVPRDLPAHSLPEPLDAGDRRTRHERERGVTRLQVRQFA